MAGVPTDVLALVELVVVLHVLFHRFAYRMVLVVIHDVSVRNVLSVNTTAAFDEWELLGVEVLVRVGGEAATHRLLLVLLVVPAGGQVWQLLLSFAELFIMLFLIRVDALDLVGASDFDFGAVAAHVVGVLAVL